MSVLLICQLEERPNRQAPPTPSAGLTYGQSNPVPGFLFHSGEFGATKVAAAQRELKRNSNDCSFQYFCYHFNMNHKHRKTLDALLTDPVNGNLDWLRIESLLLALGCRVIEGPGSAVTFEHAGRRANFHRPHLGKEALRYRIKAVREFIEKIGVEP